MRCLAKSAMLLAMLLGLAANAPQALGQLSLNSVVDLALRTDPRVKAAEANVVKAQAVLAQVHDAVVPTVSIGGGYGKSTGPPLGLPTVFSISSQSLVFNFSQHSEILAAKAGLEAANLTLKDTQDQVKADVAETYVSLNNARALKATLVEEEGFAQHLTTIVNERVNAGLDTQIDLIGAQLTGARIHVLVLERENSISDLEGHLMRSIGLPEKHLETVPDSIPTMPDIGMNLRDNSLSFGVQAAFEDARSRHNAAVAAGEYLYRPQISMVGNYSRLNTSPSESNFLVYYPTFAGKSNNDAAIAIQIEIPLFDRAHQAHAQELDADAKHHMYEAEGQKNQFLEEREKQRRSLELLKARSNEANLEREYAKAQLNAVLAELAANNAATGTTPMTPKDEQNARLEERRRYADYLSSEHELDQATIQLLLQTGQLSTWLNSGLHAPATAPSNLITP